MEDDEYLNDREEFGAVYRKPNDEDHTEAFFALQREGMEALQSEQLMNDERYEI